MAEQANTDLLEEVSALDRMGASGDVERVRLLMRLQKMALGRSVRRVDAVLEQIDVRKLSEISLITLLRGTFSFSERLGSWKGLRDRVREEFDRRGADSRKLLLGLQD